jgi:hypothetical protein
MNIKKIADRQSALFVDAVRIISSANIPIASACLCYADKEARIQKVMERDGMAAKKQKNTWTKSTKSA